jgi:hypothetical protein
MINSPMTTRAIADIPRPPMIELQWQIAGGLRSSLPEDKLAGDLGNVIEATSIRRSSVSFFKSKKIGAGQFGTFSTASTRRRL